MSKLFLSAGLLIAVAMLISPEVVSAQGCNTCNTCSAGAPVAAAPVVVGSFGFPSSGCGGGCQSGGVVGRGGCASGACRAELKAKRAHQSQIKAKIIARNEAWPKPCRMASDDRCGFRGSKHPDRYALRCRIWFVDQVWCPAGFRHDVEHATPSKDCFCATVG